MTACASESEVWIAQRDAALEEAQRGDFEAILREAWTRDTFDAPHLGVLGEFADVPEVGLELVAIYRFHPDPYTARSAFLKLVVHTWSSHPKNLACAGWGCLDGSAYMAIEKLPRPRLFYAEACASLGLRWMDEPGAWDYAIPPQCLTEDGYSANPEAVSHLLWLRQRGWLATPITGATLPFPFEEHLWPADRDGARRAARYRLIREEGYRIRHEELWRADLASWVRAGSDGETRVPGPPPTPFTVPPEPTRRAWERVGVPPAPEFP